MKSKPRILFLVPESYAALSAKGIVHMIMERDENGFFDKVITVHPLSFKNQVLALSERHVLYEFNLRWFLTPAKIVLLPLMFIKFILMVNQLYKLIKTEKIDLIRATDPYLMGSIALILSRLTSVPFCISIHSDYGLVFKLCPEKGFKNLLRKCTKWMPNLVLPKAHLILPISNYLKETIAAPIQTEKVRIIFHGIDFDFEPPMNLSTYFSIPKNKKIISFVGRLSSDNFIDDILAITEKLAEKRNDFLLLLVGGGELESKIKEWLERRNMKSFVRLLGFQPNHIGRSVRYISDISLCLMGGYSLIEAAAAKSPSISYDVEWHKELVVSYETGFLIPKHHIDKVCEAINYLLDHPDKAKEMGQKARLKAYAYHDIKKTSQLKQDYYTELLNISSSK